MVANFLTSTTLLSNYPITMQHLGVTAGVHFPILAVIFCVMSSVTVLFSYVVNVSLHTFGEAWLVRTIKILLATMLSFRDVAT